MVFGLGILFISKHPETCLRHHGESFQRAVDENDSAVGNTDLNSEERLNERYNLTQQEEEDDRSNKDLQELLKSASLKDQQDSDVNSENEDTTVDQPESIKKDLSSSDSILKSLIKHPKNGDILDYALVTSAPYSSLQDLKYKVKIIPGNLKKGKAVRSVLQFWNNLKETGEDASPYAFEKELIVDLKDVEVINSVGVTNIKPVLPSGGSSKAATKQKNKKG